MRRQVKFEPSWEDGWEPEFNDPPCEHCEYQPAKDGHAEGCPNEPVCPACLEDIESHAVGCPEDMEAPDTAPGDTPFDRRDEIAEEASR